MKDALLLCISCLLSLIILGSSTAFNDLVSLSVSSLQSSYLVAISLLFYRRSTGAILPPSLSVGSYPVKDIKIRWGQWHIPGSWGIANNEFACAYLTVMVFFSFWPTERPVTAEKYELRRLSDGSSCNLQPGLLPRMGEESIYRTGDRGGVNAGRSSTSVAYRHVSWKCVTRSALRNGRSI